MDQKFIDLFDRYTHGGMHRRDFLERLTALAGSSAAATALLPVLENNYAQAEMAPGNDPSIIAEAAGIAPGIKGYLRAPQGGGRLSRGAGYPRESRLQSAHQGRDAAHGKVALRDGGANLVEPVL